MIQSKQKVKDLCDRLMQVKPHQILIDMVQDNIEEILTDDKCTPDDVTATSYQCDILLEIYDLDYKSDVEYLTQLRDALTEWGRDKEFANKSLGLDPNQ